MAQVSTVEVTYTITNPAQELSPGMLCVIAVAGKNAGDVVTPAETGVCLGAGICSTKDNSNRYTIRIDGIDYKFTPSGAPASGNAAEWWCYLAQANKAPVEIGSVAGSMKNIVITRKDDGSIEENIEGDTSIVIDSLNARDHYALQVLHGFLEHIQNPSALSTNEISFYCDKAYEWASYLMTTAAMARAASKRETPVDPQTVEVEDFESNTEILLNNLILELAKTDLTETENSKEITSKLVTIRQMSTLVSAISALSSSVNAQKSYLESISNNIRAQKSALESISRALESIKDELGTIDLNITYTDN